MNTKQPLSYSLLQKIARSKRLRFTWNEKTKTYIMYDAKTDIVMMEYSPITISMLVSERKWREECNKLKPTYN